MSSKPPGSKNTSKIQDPKAKSKNILPFNKQLLDLQKKIQQVEDKNQRILQQIHKAYNFKKKKIYYQTQGNSDGQDDENYSHQDGGEMETQRYQDDNINSTNNKNLPQYQQRTSYGQFTFHQSAGNFQNKPQLPIVNQFSVTQPPLSPSKYVTPTISPTNARRYDQNPQKRLQQPYIKPIILQTRKSNNSMHHQKNNSDSPIEQEQNHQYRYKYHQEDNQQPLEHLSNNPRMYQQNNDYEQQQESEYKSSNYSDVQKRQRINQIVKKRQKDFSDIKSNIQERRLVDDVRHGKKKYQQTRKSFVYQDLENNSLYSEGNMADRDNLGDEDLEEDEEDLEENPHTQYYLDDRKGYKRNVGNQQLYARPSQKLMMHSNQQLQSPKVGYTYSKVPISPVSNNNRKYSPMRHSAYVKNPSYIQNHTMPQSQVNFLQQMFKTQRQKNLHLQKQLQQKDQKILNLKKYKKNFKTFINNSYYVIQQAFDQYVEQFLKNRLYQIQKMVKKNEKRLSALLINLKDMKEERVYHKNLKKHFQNKRGYYSTDQRDSRKENNKRTLSPENGRNEEQNQNLFEQNYSTVTSRSRQRQRQRSVSATKRKKQQRDRSIAKKSNQSQLMKKQFTNIADKYESMLKIKNDQIQKIQSELKHTRQNIQVLQEQNNKLKQQAAQLSTSNVQSSQSEHVRRNSGNLRILSRSSSKNQLKKNVTNAALVQENQQLSQKLKKLQKQLQSISQQKSSIQQRFQQLREQNQKYSTQLTQLTKKFQTLLSQKQSTPKNQQILSSSIYKKQQTLHNEEKQKITKLVQQLEGKNIELIRQLERLQIQCKQKDKKISQLDSSIFMKTNQLKKMQNLLTIKNTKLQQLNKLLLSNSSTQAQTGNNILNDSIASIIQQPQNKSTLIMLHNLQKQLQQQKYEKQVQFLKLKKSYESKIQQLKIQFQEIVLENDKLEDKLKEEMKKGQEAEKQKSYLVESNEELKEEVSQLKTQISFLNNKIGFYENERQELKHSGGNVLGNRSNSSKNRSVVNCSLQNKQQSNNNIFDVNDFDDFPEQENSIEQQNKMTKSVQSYKPGSGQIQLLEQSSNYTASFQHKRVDSVIQQSNNTPSPNPKTPFTSIKHPYSLRDTSTNPLQFISLKDQNIELCQKIAKLQKQLIFSKQCQKQYLEKIQNLKHQINNLNQKYEEINNHNNELVKFIQELEKEKAQILKNVKESHGTSPFDWKEIQKNIEPVELKGSGIYGAWNFVQKDDILLDKSSVEFGIRDSMVSHSNFLHSNRPSKQQTQKKIQQLTRKLAQTQILLQNKQNMNQEIIKGFTKKFDILNTQIQEQTKLIQKYIHENSKLRKQKEKIEDEVDKLKKDKQRIQGEVEKLRKENLELGKKLKELEQFSVVNQYKGHLEQGNMKPDNKILDDQEESQQDNLQVQEDQFQLMQQRIDQFNFFPVKNKIKQEQQQQQTEKKPLLNQQENISKQNNQFTAQQDNEDNDQQNIVTFQPMLQHIQEQQEDIEQMKDDLQYKTNQIQMLQTQVKQQQQTIDQLQKCLKQTLMKVKSKQEEKMGLVEQLRKKNEEVEELRDLIQLKETGRHNQLNLSKSISNHGGNVVLDRSSIDKSERPRYNSIGSLKYSQTIHGGSKARRQSYQSDQINFNLQDALGHHHHNNLSVNMMLEQSHLSGMYSENMSAIFEKQQNFLEQIKKAKNKRKQQGKLLKRTFQYIKKLRTALNDKNKRIKLLEHRLEELKDNCWLWKKNGDHNMSGQKNQLFAETSNQKPEQKETNQQNHHENSGIQVDYIDHNESFSMQQKNKLVDSRLFQCNSQDLNKKKPRRHNHYKKLEYDTKLICEQNKILTKQIQMLQQQILKIQQQQNGLMAVKQIYKEQIRVLTRQNQELSSSYQVQIGKLQEKLENSQSIHNFEAIKQLFKKIIDNVAVMLHPSTFSIDLTKKKHMNQMKQQKRKEAEECIKVLCSILDYDDMIKNQLCTKLSNSLHGGG